MAQHRVVVLHGASHSPACGCTIDNGDENGRDRDDEDDDDGREREDLVVVDHRRRIPSLIKKWS